MNFKMKEEKINKSRQQILSIPSSLGLLVFGGLRRVVRTGFRALRGFLGLLHFLLLLLRLFVRCLTCEWNKQELIE